MSEIVVPKKIYIAVWLALLVLLGLTVAVAYVHLGRLNVVAAMAIAFLKASVIILYFMHVRYASRLTWLFVGAGFFWLALLFVLTFGDYFTREFMPPPTDWKP